jgi:hypothetical protein
MLHIFVHIIKFVCDLAKAVMKFLEDGGVTKVVSKLDPGNLSLPNYENVYPDTYREPLHGS